MVAKLFLVIILAYCAYAFFAKEKYHLIMIVFILTSNFFGFQMFMGDRKGDVIFVYLVALWLYFYFFKNYKFFIVPALKPNIYLTVGFLFFLILNLVISILEYNQLVPSIKVFREIFRYSSILLFLFILLHFEKAEVTKFIDLLEIITVVLCFFYVVNFGAGIKIFGVSSYGQGAYIGGVQLQRNFLALPHFISFFFLRLILREKYNKFIIAGIFTILLTAFLTYTRSFIASTVVLGVIGLFLRNFKYGKSIVKLVKIMAIIPIVMVVLGIFIGMVFPNQLQFLMMRVGDVNSIESAAEDHNLNLRTEIIKSRLRKTLEKNPVTGLGYLHVETSGHFYPDLFVRPGDRPGQVVVGDQSWGNLIALIGFGGAALYLTLFFYPVVFLLKRGLFLKQNITLIAAALTIANSIMIFAFIGKILTSKYFFLSFLLSLIVYYTNAYLYKPYLKFLENQPS